MIVGFKPICQACGGGGGGAPQLNPDEAVWADAKGQLANGCPNDITVLNRRLRRTLRDIKGPLAAFDDASTNRSSPPFCADYCILYTEINSRKLG